MPIGPSSDPRRSVSPSAARVTLCAMSCVLSGAVPAQRSVMSGGPLSEVAYATPSASSQPEIGRTLGWPIHKTRKAPACGSFPMNDSEAAKSLCGARHRPPPAAIERGDDADGERGRGRQRRELSPPESVATQIDLERPDAETGSEREAHGGRGEQGVGRGQPHVDPSSGGHPRERRTARPRSSTRVSPNRVASLARSPARARRRRGTPSRVAPRRATRSRSEGSGRARANRRRPDRLPRSPTSLRWG